MPSAMSSLKAKLYRGPWRNDRIPGKIGRIVLRPTAEVGAPAMRNTRCIVVLPGNLPLMNSRAAVIGQANAAGKAAAPIVGNVVFTEIIA